MSYPLGGSCASRWCWSYIDGVSRDAACWWTASAALLRVAMSRSVGAEHAGNIVPRLGHVVLLR